MAHLTDEDAIGASRVLVRIVFQVEESGRVRTDVAPEQRDWYHVPRVGDKLALKATDGTRLLGVITAVLWADEAVAITYRLTP